MIKLDILSDPICPWCYIGKAQLDQAMDTDLDPLFEIEWHPFQLNPTMPRDGMDRVEYLEHKFGGREGAMKAYAPIVEMSENLGLEIDFSAIKRTPNTMNAHRLIHWAGLEGRQTPVVSFLFRAYFNQGRDIGDRDVLLDIAEEAEMDRAVIARLLSGDADLKDIAARDSNAREKGVSGVPTHIIAGQHVLPGAQPAAVWHQVIADISAQLENQDS